MNAISDVAGAQDETMSAVHAPPQLYTLRRTGRKPVRFSGWQVVDAQGAGENGALWYDLALYRSDSNAIIVELVARRQKLDAPDLSRVEVFDSLAAASSWLESYTCSHDVPVPTDLAVEGKPMVDAVLQAVQLRQHIERIRDDYQGLLSDVFEILDLADTASPQRVPEPA
jgi:hypothetical protein